MITMEILTFFGSYILSFLSTSFASAMKAKAQQQEWLYKMAGLQEKSTRAARKVTDKHTKTTRRYLALMASTVLIMGVIWLAATGVPVVVETTVTSGGWLFFPERETTKFETINGIPFLDVYVQILISVFGLYFGNNHAK